VEPIFLTCMVIAYFFTKGKVDTAAYASGKESPGVAKARMRHESGGGGRSASGRPKGKGAFRLMLADRWANACESARQRGEHKAKRRRAWFAETAPQRDAAWREKQLRKLGRADDARRKWAERQGLIDLSEFRKRKDEDEAWKENERRNAEAAAAAATTDPAAAPTGTDPATPTGDPAASTDPAKPDEAKPTEDAATDGKDETKPDAEQPDTAPADAEKAEEPTAEETKADEKAEDDSTTPAEPEPAAGTDPAAAGTGEAAKADTPAGSATTPKNSDAAGKAGDSVYNAAADRLINAAERVEQYRADLAAMADGLDGKKWGVEVHGPIRDMDGHLSTVASTYRDLAGQMQQQGDSVSDAHDAHPYVPADAEVVFA
jgi:outer membrane biosynthesis protein TonB